MNDDDEYETTRRMRDVFLLGLSLTVLVLVLLWILT